MDRETGLAPSSSFELGQLIGVTLGRLPCLLPLANGGGFWCLGCATQTSRDAQTRLKLLKAERVGRTICVVIAFKGTSPPVKDLVSSADQARVAVTVYPATGAEGSILCLDFTLSGDGVANLVGCAGVGAAGSGA